MNALVSLLVAVCLAFSVGGCAVQKRDAEAPGTYQSVEDAERDLTSAEGSLTRALPPGQQSRPGTVSEAPKMAPSADEPAAPADAGAREPSPCEVACRALASMARAADAVCRLAGPDDPRCLSARKRVEDATTRAQACSCGSR